MQCGIKLLVKENKVVGFDPWMEFPLMKEGYVQKGFNVIYKIIIPIEF